MALGELERDVMDRLWAAGEPRTVRQIHSDLAADRDLAYTTVMTVLDRLARKEMVQRVRDGRAWLYSPAHTRDELAAELMREALDGAGEDRTGALVHFAESVSSEEAAALREVLGKIQRDHPPR